MPKLQTSEQPKTSEIYAFAIIFALCRNDSFHLN